ncbi:hypothetical protein [Halorhabdus amylolytica]|uniref:hypothetical protein n=1 Tax=Halorhabdus amylolytica TaxID=2559573 RepID=UPI0010AAB021|nr:hypothetical protein [Halorhabdus amylolytica]
MTPRDDRECGVRWEDVGRGLLRSELGKARTELVEASHDVEDTLRKGEAVTHEQVRQLRLALNHARRCVEDYAAPVAGVEPWGDPVPPIPYRVMHESIGRGSTDDIDPLEHLDREVADE